MRFVLFYPSVRSDWNNGNAHFLRGVAAELVSHGHAVHILEPVDGWSATNLAANHGERALVAYRDFYPDLGAVRYDLRALLSPVHDEPRELHLDKVLFDADVVIVHEWSDPALVAAIGRARRRAGARRFALLFHDTHHRSVTNPEAMAAYDLSGYDAVLAFGDIIRRLYLRRGWAKRAYTWHEAADVRVFYPRIGEPLLGDVVWIGNWGDEERSAELKEFLLEPVKELGLRARVYGVRYPGHALAALADARIEYGGYLPNVEVPAVLARYRVTVHVPRRAYATLLPGIPTIRPFEALACGVPLVCAPWDDAEGLFTPGRDFLVATSGGEMKAALRRLLDDPAAASSLAEHGKRTITARHTCAHRVDELLRICRELVALPATLPKSAAEGALS